MLVWLAARKRRARQKKTALKLMVLSGVVRPVDAEVRYAVPLASVSSTFRRAGAVAPSKQPLVAGTATQARRDTTGSLSACRPALSVKKLLAALRRRHVGLQWIAEQS